MTGYDPQRNRARAQPATDGPAPVDMLLSGDTPRPPVPAGETELPASVPEEAHEAHEDDHRGHEHGGHEHGPDCDHDHDGDPRVMIAAAAVSTVAVVLGLRRWRRRGRSAE